MYSRGPLGRTAETFPSTCQSMMLRSWPARLVAVVTDARKGRFSEHGVKIAEDLREQDLKGAWLVLGIEDLNNGD
jgi:hypothetical protein